MRLSKTNKDKKLKRLLSNLEKIAKISALRISKDYTDSVVDDLNWINNNFISFLKLRETKPEYFITFLSPNYRFRKKEVLSDGFDNFLESIALVEDTTEEMSRDLFDGRYQPQFPVFNKLNENDLILRYIQSVFTIWDAAGVKQNRHIEKCCQLTFINWISIIDKMQDNEIDYGAILKAILDNLNFRNFHVLNNTTDRLPDGFSYFSYGNYLNRIFSDNVLNNNIEIYFDYLFRLLYQAIEIGNYVVVENFIARCIDSNFYPSFRNNYSSLYTLIEKSLNDRGIDDNNETLKPIAEFGFYRLRYIQSIKEFERWKSEFQKYLKDRIGSHKKGENEIAIQIAVLEKDAYDYYKFNHLQTIVLELLALCLFKGHTSVLKYALNYNQPSDSNAVQVNKDFVPRTINEILNVVDYKYEMERALVSYWDGHHGIEPYLNKLFIILFYNYSGRSYYGNENISSAVSIFIKYKLGGDSGKIEGLKYQIERLKIELETYVVTGKMREFIADKEKVEYATTILDKIIEICERELVEIETKDEISDKIVDNFIESIINAYHKQNYFNRFFRKYGETIEAKIDDKYAFGISELMNRTAFIDNWHVPYLGFSERHGFNLAEHENRNAQFLLTEDLEGTKLRADEIVNVLKKYSKEDYLVILRNIHSDMIFRQEETYKPVFDNSEMEDIIPGFFQGTVVGLPIFGLYDNLFKKSILVIRNTGLLFNENVGELTEGFKKTYDFKTSFIDFATYEEQRKHMVNSPPQWIKEELGTDHSAIDDYLMKLIWIRMSKRSIFKKGAQAECYLYEIE